MTKKCTSKSKSIKFFSASREVHKLKIFKSKSKISVKFKVKAREFFEAFFLVKVKRYEWFMLLSQDELISCFQRIKIRG